MARRNLSKPYDGPERAGLFALLTVHPLARIGSTRSSEGSRRIARCRIELYAWLKHARAWDEVCFQTDAVGVLEQHRIVTRRPCSLLRALDYRGPNLSKQIMQAIHVFA